MRDAAFLVFPSQWYECMPIVLLEAFASGLPIISSDLGAMKEMIRPGETGLLFTPGNPQELAQCVERLVGSTRLRRKMGVANRAEYELKYTAERGYEGLMSLYETLI